MTLTFSVKNFSKFQHYKDRAPPWIKLYNELLDDYQFAHLPDASKAHLIAIWLLASRYENKIPCDPAWVSRRINATEPVDLKILLDAGFIEADQACSETLADCKQVARPETERETEVEREERGANAPLSAEPTQAFNEWNELARELNLSIARPLRGARKKKLSLRLGEVGLSGWREALNKIRGSPHCQGHNDRGWTVSLDFMLEPEKLQRLLEGKYDDRGPQRTGTIADGIARLKAKYEQHFTEGAGEGGPVIDGEVAEELPRLRQGS